MFQKCLRSSRILGNVKPELHLRSLSYKPQLYTEDNKKRCVEYMKKLSSRRKSGILEKFDIKKRHAVLVSLCVVDNEESILFTERSYDMPTHKGQVSFPGGGVHINETIIEGCLRETEEEIGISQVDVWDILPPIPDQAMTSLVYPVVGNIGHIKVEELKICPREVEKAFTLPLTFFFDQQNVGYTRFQRKDKKGTYLTPVYLSKPRVWGLTALAVDITLGILAPDRYSSFSIKL